MQPLAPLPLSPSEDEQHPVEYVSIEVYARVAGRGPRRRVCLGQPAQTVASSSSLRSFRSLLTVFVVPHSSLRVMDLGLTCSATNCREPSALTSTRGAQATTRPCYLVFLISVPVCGDSQET